jgi:uncharacterized protein YbjT (DUF2867 family)
MTQVIHAAIIRQQENASDGWGASSASGGCSAMTDRLVTVFGGTGFLGRRVVRHLLDCGMSVRVASRHPDRSRELFPSSVEAMAADIHDEGSVARACTGSSGVVNAVSLYVEHSAETFHSVHVQAAARVAKESSRAGVGRIIHVSGIGSDPASRSPYIRSRGQGEAAVRSAFPGAVLIRPAVMFGPDDKFLTIIINLLRRLPVYPMFGRGNTRLAPASVEDVAEAIARCLQSGRVGGEHILECAGPRIYTYAELLKTIAGEIGVRTHLMPMPFSVWHALGFVAEFLPNPPVTRNQVELMQLDNVASPNMQGFGDLGILPQSIDRTIRLITQGPVG